MKHCGPPTVHDIVTCVDVPTLITSRVDGQIRTATDGFFDGDRRLLSRLELRIDGEQPVHLDTKAGGDSTALFTSVAREGPSGASIIVERRRCARSSHEAIAISNTGQTPQSIVVELLAASDFADIADVRGGRSYPVQPPEPLAGGLSWQPDVSGPTVTLTADPPAGRCDPDSGSLRWTPTIEPGQAWEMCLTLATSGPSTDAVIVRGPRPAPWALPGLRCTDRRLGELATRSLTDLEGLLAADPAEPSDPFLAAGAPWYLTLFGRDSLWAARMMLPLGTELAAGTLRTLARRQGTRIDEETEEAPGKIPHELRHEASTYGLPPAYFGTVDATPLFVCLLADAWRWGLPADQVSSLLPAAENALAWLREHADPDGDGFLEYAPTGPQTLANQGWKDSVDGVRFADGRLANAPIALAEVQAYAYEAAVKGADLLDAFSRPGGDEWRGWARGLRERFRKTFWVEDRTGAYPAIALDAAKQPVDSVASNMGHLLATGLLDPAEEAVIARRLVSPELDSGWGLRTLSRDNPAFNPLGYHTGSVWPHDTAIAAAGLARSGHEAAAATLLRGLVDAAPRFSYRLPELYGGQGRTTGHHGPVPYPSTCQPQAWAAAAGVVVLQVLLGLEVDAPRGTVSVAAASQSPYGPLEVRNLRAAGQPLSIRTDEHRDVYVDELAPGLTVTRR